MMKHHNQGNLQKKELKFGAHRFIGLESMTITVERITGRPGTVAVPEGMYLHPQDKDSLLGMAWALETSESAFSDTHLQQSHA